MEEGVQAGAPSPMQALVVATGVSAPPGRVFGVCVGQGAPLVLVPDMLMPRLLSTWWEGRPGERLRVRYGAWPVRGMWTLVRETVEPPRLLVERQDRGPYRHWLHRRHVLPWASGSLLVEELHAQPGRWLMPFATAGAWEAWLRRRLRAHHLTVACGLGAGHQMVADSEALELLMDQGG